ncbi:MAG: uracil-DNA glycosylase family protein [Candidatus Paracaedibacter sp.]
MEENISFQETLHNVNHCNRCADQITHQPRPIMRGLPSAKILIIGQAPGLKAHETGLSFNDASGNRLRSWLRMERHQFYDERKIAIIPIGLCYPGKDKASGDLPPLKRCAPFWHPQLLPLFSNIKLTLLVGSYAQKFYLKERYKDSLAETMLAFEEYLPQYFCLPHPSWRNTGWLKRYPWFEIKILPSLRSRVQEILLENG